MITVLYDELQRHLPEGLSESMYLRDDHDRIMIDDIPLQEGSAEFDTLIGWVVQVAENIGGIDKVQYLATDSGDLTTLVIKVDLCEEEY